MEKKDPKHPIDIRVYLFFRNLLIFNFLQIFGIKYVGYHLPEADEKTTQHTGRKKQSNDSSSNTKNTRSNVHKNTKRKSSNATEQQSAANSHKKNSPKRRPQGTAMYFSDTKNPVNTANVKSQREFSPYVATSSELSDELKADLLFMDEINN